MNSIRVMFLRDHRQQPQGCLAIKLDDERHVASYQVSVLHPSDRFNRPLARQLAKGRLVEAPLEVNISSAMGMHEITATVLYNLLTHTELPSRARKAAKLWLNKNLSTSLVGEYVEHIYSQSFVNLQKNEDVAAVSSDTVSPFYKYNKLKNQLDVNVQRESKNCAAAPPSTHSSRPPVEVGKVHLNDDNDDYSDVPF